MHSIYGQKLPNQQAVYHFALFHLQVTKLNNSTDVSKDNYVKEDEWSVN